MLTENKRQRAPSSTFPSLLPTPPGKPTYVSKTEMVKRGALNLGSTPRNTQHPEEQQGGRCWPNGDGCPGAACAGVSVRGTGQTAPVLPTCPVMARSAF